MPDYSQYSQFIPGYSGAPITPNATPGIAPSTINQTPGYLVDPLVIAQKLIQQKQATNDYGYTSASIDRALSLLGVRTQRTQRDETNRFTRGLRNLPDPFLRAGLNNSGLTNTAFTDFRTDHTNASADILAEYDSARGDLMAQRNKALRDLASVLGLSETDLLQLGAGNLANSPINAIR